MRLEGVGQRRARLHPLVHVVEDGLEERIGDAAAQQVERLHERHARLEQRRQLLVEDEELARADAPAPRQPEREPAEAPLRLEREDVQALLLELVAQARLAVGDVDALDDLAGRGDEPAAEFHRKILSDSDDYRTIANPRIISSSPRTPMGIRTAALAG